MKRLLLVIMAMTIALTEVFVVHAVDDKNVLNCVKASAQTCDFLSAEDFTSLQVYAVLADRDTLHAYAKHENNPWGAIFTAAIFPSTIRDTSVQYGVKPGLFPEEITFSLNDYVGIPNLGVLYQNGNFAIWRPIWFTAYDPDNLSNGVDIASSTFDQPVEYTLSEIILRTEDSAMLSYFKATPTLTLLYYWDFEIKDGGMATIVLDKVEVQVHDTGVGLWEYNYRPLPKDAVVLNRSEIANLNLMRGDSVGVSNVYTLTTASGARPWSVLFDILKYVELNIEGNTYIIDMEDIKITYQTDCQRGQNYFPSIGEWLWVTGTAEGLELSREKPFRNLNSEEGSFVNASLESAYFQPVQGTITEETADGGLYYFTLSTTNGSLSFMSFEKQTPAIGTFVTAYLHNNQLSGLETTEGWWKLNLEEGSWTPSQTCLY